MKNQTRTIGHFVPSPRLKGKMRKNKREAMLVNDTIRFHGARLAVQVHHSYPSRLFKSKIRVAGGREVHLRERDVEVFIDDHLVEVQFRMRQKRGRRRKQARKLPIYGAFLHELPKKVLAKFPVILSYNSACQLAGIKILR